MFRQFCRESYSDPREVYDTLKRRGMDLVTITDHDSIDAAETLRRHPDFFLSEEVTCELPSGSELHVGVYGIQERHHTWLQRYRKDFPALAAYLADQGLLFSVNHAFSAITGDRFPEDFQLFARHFPAVEVLNGQIPRICNQQAAAFAARMGRAQVAGSDAHTFAELGRTYTEASGARNSAEFLELVRMGGGQCVGDSGRYWKLTGAICEIGLRMMQETAWTRMLAPLFLAVPAVIAGNFLREILFARRWRSWDRYVRDPAAMRSAAFLPSRTQSGIPIP